MNDNDDSQKWHNIAEMSDEDLKTEYHFTYALLYGHDDEMIQGQTLRDIRKAKFLSPVEEWSGDGDWTERQQFSHNLLVLLHEMVKRSFAKGWEHVQEEFIPRANFRPTKGTTKPVTETEIQQILTLHKDGYSHPEIAREVHRNESTIGNVIREHCDCPKCVRKRGKPV